MKIEREGFASPPKTCSRSSRAVTSRSWVAVLLISVFPSSASVAQSDAVNVASSIPGLPANATATTAAASLNVLDLLRWCESNFSTRDQRTRLTIINRNKEGKEKKGVYRRYTKNYVGSNSLRQKMILFAEYPPDSKGLAFMRWEYVPEAEKTPDQWLYSPSLGSVRRISVRDLGESFLGSTLTLEDIGIRHAGQDSRRIVEIKPEGLSEVAWVEFTPKTDSQYSKRLVKYLRTGPTWESCVTAQIDYYDKKELLQKRQEFSWQRVENMPVWKKVIVTNTQTAQTSTFEIDDIRFDVKLDDELFTERTLRRGDR